MFLAIFRRFNFQLTTTLALLIFVVASFAPASSAAADEVSRIEVRQLQEGKIPKRLLENWRVCDLESQSAKDFDRIMNDYAKRIFTDHDFASNPVRFIILDEPEINGFVVSRARPILIGITKGALQRLGSLDQLLYLVGHEFGHLAVNRKMGQAQNTKGEEFAADLYPLKKLEAAGFNSKEALSFSLLLESESKSRRDPKASRFWELVDVHGLAENRVKAIEKGLAFIDRDLGGLRHPTQAMTDEIREIAKTAKHKSHFDQTIDRDQYEDLDNIQKLKALGDQLPSLMKGYSARLEEFQKLIRDLELNPKDSAEAQAIAEFANKILAHPLYEKLYSRLSLAVFKDETARPLGRLRLIADAAKTFQDSKTKQEALTNATKLIAAIESEKLPAEFLRTIKWPNFSLPNGERFQGRKRPEVTVDWNNFISYAEADRTGQVGRALLYLGVDDPRLYSSLNLQTADEFFSGQVQAISEGPSRDGDTLNNFVWDEDGLILKYEPYIDKDSRATRSAQRFRLRNESINEKLGKLVTLTMKGNAEATKTLLSLNERFQFQGNELMGLPILGERYDVFYKLNAKIIADASTDLQPGEALKQSERERAEAARKIIASLLAEFTKLVKIDRDRFTPLVKSFFLGRKDQQDLKHLGYFEDMNLAHPFASFVIWDTNGLFTQEEKIVFVSGLPDFFTANLRGELIGSPVEALRKLFDYKAPKTRDELFDLQKLVENKIKSASANLKSPLAESENRETFKQAFLYLEFREWVRSTKPSDFNIEEFLPYLDPHHFERDEEFLNDVRERYVVERKKWPTDVDGLALAFKQIDSFGLFPKDQKLRFEILTTLIKKIEKEPQSRKRLEYAESLLLSRRIQEPKLRERVMNLWVESIFQTYGFDQGERKYKDIILGLAHKIRAQLNFTDAESVIAKLADRVEAQRELSAELGAIVKDVRQGERENSQILGTLTESTLNLVRRDEESRIAILQLLTSSGDKGSIENIVELFRKQASLAVSKEMMQKYRTDAKLMYDNFWAAPMAARAIILDELLFPQGQKSNDEFEKSFEYVLNKLFAGEKYSFEARQILKDYVEIIPDYQRTLLISSMMVAAQRSIHDEENLMPIGEKLALVLELMGPAETKLGQATHSHPSVPDDIRDGMNRLKQSSDVPRRWNLFNLFDESVPESKRKDLRVKKVLGAASYYVVFEVENKQGGREVFAVLRRNALERAKNGFDLLIQLAEKRSKNDPVYQTLISLIDQARFMADIETDSRIGAEQAKKAASLYDGVTVQVGSRSFKFSTATVTDSGKNYRRMKKAEGVHFNDLPESTAEEREFKSDLARAYLSLELQFILAGGEFDHDRHGAQMKVNGNEVVLFDHGAMALNPPTEQERKQMAEVVFESLKANQDGGNLAEEIFKHIRRIHEQTGEIPRYLVTIQKGLLALQDFARHVPKDEFASILKAAAEPGIHPDIQEVLMRKVAESPKLIDSFTSQSAKCKPILIKLAQ